MEQPIHNQVEYSCQDSKLTSWLLVPGHKESKAPRKQTWLRIQCNFFGQKCAPFENQDP